MLKKFIKKVQGVINPLPVKLPTPVLDISAPLYTIVAKVKSNPSRIVIEREGLLRFDWKFTDKETGLAGGCTYSGTPCTPCIYISGLSLTSDEEGYLIKELGPIFLIRKSRFEEIKQLRAERKERNFRITVQKQWEDS